MGVAVRQGSLVMFSELVKLVGAIRARALVSPTIPERLTITRDKSLICVAFHTISRVFDLRIQKRHNFYGYQSAPVSFNLDR